MGEEIPVIHFHFPRDLDAVEDQAPILPGHVQKIQVPDPEAVLFPLENSDVEVIPHLQLPLRQRRIDAVIGEQPLAEVEVVLGGIKAQRLRLHVGLYDALFVAHDCLQQRDGPVEHPHFFEVAVQEEFPVQDGAAIDRQAEGLDVIRKPLLLLSRNGAAGDDGADPLQDPRHLVLPRLRREISQEMGPLVRAQFHALQFGDELAADQARRQQRRTVDQRGDPSEEQFREGVLVDVLPVFRHADPECLQQVFVPRVEQDEGDQRFFQIVPVQPLWATRPCEVQQLALQGAADVNAAVVCPDGRQLPGIEAEQLSAVRYQPFQAGEQVLLPGHLPGPGDAAFNELKPENQGEGHERLFDHSPFAPDGFPSQCEKFPRCHGPCPQERVGLLEAQSPGQAEHGDEVTFFKAQQAGSRRLADVPQRLEPVGDHKGFHFPVAGSVPAGTDGVRFFGKCRACPG